MNTKYFSNFANNTDSGFYVYVFVIHLYKGKNIKVKRNFLNDNLSTYNLLRAY